MSKRDQHWQAMLKESVLRDPESRAEYEAFKLQLEFADKMKTLRQKAHLSQDDIAAKLQTTKSTIARLEAGGGKNKHSPTLKTLVKCADALGYRLELNFKP